MIVEGYHSVLVELNFYEKLKKCFKKKVKDGGVIVGCYALIEGFGG